MMTKGVIYYNRGTKCLVRLFVSLYSLRKHYDGPVSIICAGKQENWVADAAAKLNADVVAMPDQDSCLSLALKGSLWRYSPYDMTMFMDADTIVLNPIDEYFDYIEEHDFVTGNFANWKTAGGTISRRIRQWKKVVPEMMDPAINYGHAVNTGINGWKRGASILTEWERLCQLGNKHQCSTRVLDEIACQILLPHHKHHIADTRWGESVKYGKCDESTVIVHYHGNKHVGDRPQNNIWKTHYNELIHKYDMPYLNTHYGDRSFRGYLKKIQKNLTLVSAVNQKYFGKMKSNFPLWQKTENIMELSCVIFAHKEVYDEAVEYFKPWNHVTVHRWEFPIAGDNMREEMLSAFVFGVAKHVNTKYWMKLDCDTTPTRQKLEIPEDAFRSAITASSWHYTKVKGDPSDDPRHWLVRLDDWADGLDDFKGTERMFPEKIEGRRHRHRRIASFCEIEKTNWTKHLASMCKDRLPVPSQDTTTWYAATRLGRKISVYKFRRFLSP